jgi:hypothetical protein
VEQGRDLVRQSAGSGDCGSHSLPFPRSGPGAGARAHQARSGVLLVGLSGLAALLCDGAGSALYAAQWVGVLPAESIVTHDPSDPALGDYYTFSLQFPATLQGRTIRDAVLECYVDVAAEEVNGHVNDTPMLQVFILDGPLIGEPTPEILRFPSPAARNVRLGTNRKAVLNIRDLVIDLLDDPTGDLELIMGSLLGTREGKFVLRSDVLPAGGAVKVIVWYR